MSLESVLLLGGAGFIGSALAERLEQDTDVRAVVLDIPRLDKRLSLKQQISLEEGAMRTWNWLKQA